MVKYHEISEFGLFGIQLILKDFVASVSVLSYSDKSMAGKSTGG
jgi:hypothetical protein